MPPYPAETSTRRSGAFADDAGEQARMGRISGGLWIVAALTAAVATFLPGASHVGLGWLIALDVLVLLYGIGSVTGVIPWQDASMNALAIGMAVTIPVVALAMYMTGGSLSYIGPFLVCSLLYAAFFFPARWSQSTSTNSR